MPAPDPQCGIIAGSQAKLYVCTDPDPTSAATLTWTEIIDLNEFTLTADSTDTDLNTAGWIRSLPMERGMSLTASGRVNANDPGQQFVEAHALNIGCEALLYWRFFVPGPTEADEPYKDVGFWAWASMQDVSAASTDPFSWGVELRFWNKPDDLEDGQYVPPAERRTGGGGGGGAAPQPRQQQQPAAQGTRTRAEETPQAA